MKFFKTPFFLPWFFPKREWGFSLNEPFVYLTFDDGPNPTITPWVLDELKKDDIKATFFCVGDNVRKYPEIYKRILDEGHRVGNHTMYHSNSSKTNYKDYLKSYQQAEEYIESKLFRPPYGRLTYFKQKEILKTKKIIMWSWLSYDFDVNVSVGKILEKARKQIQKGDILVLHDNEKVTERVKMLLPQIISVIQEKGLGFKVIE
jgi:peptidoglycan/xylan/chitin deacetylase (PgdA/CDA1 family)